MSAAFEAGFALAALMANDPSAAAALERLAPPLKAQMGARMEALRAAQKTDKVRAVQHLSVHARAHVVQHTHEPRRVLAILATEVERERGMVWLAAVPRHRAGWAASPSLKDRIIRQAGPTAAERAAQEIAGLEAAWPG